MNIKYDFHLHSCLSPCGSEDMTPNNIVNMAKLLGFDMIAITDHNSCKNTPATVKAGERNGLTVVPGMELCTSEEIHVICLFPAIENAMEFDQYVSKNTPKIKNRPDIFGRQIIMDENDEVVGEEENLLLIATNISVNDVQNVVRRFGGESYPAHVDKNSYSIISALGEIPPETKFDYAEISLNGDAEYLVKLNPELKSKNLLYNSDAHYLENMVEPITEIVLKENSSKCIIKALKGKTTIKITKI